MFQLNNLPRVKFPTKIVTEGITDLFNDSVKDDNVNMNVFGRDQTTPRTADNVNKNQNEQESKVTESSKRNRDSGDFPTKKKKERKRTTSKTKHSDTEFKHTIHFAQPN